MEYKDHLDRPIEVGDNVIFILPNFGGLQLGKVIKLTPKNVRVSFVRRSGWRKGAEDTAVRPAQDIVKVDGPDLVMYLLKR